MDCEASVPGRGRDLSGGHQCPRTARWLVRVSPLDPDNTFRCCTQHRDQSLAANPAASCEPLVTSNDLPIREGELVRIKRRKRTVMIRVENVRYSEQRRYMSVNGPRVRQSDHALLSNVARCELRRGYYYVPVGDVERVAAPA